jgi:MFS family permease
VREAVTLLRAEPKVRLFFATLAQSSLGTGAAYIALLVIAYERFHSPWAISLILLADFLPAMFLAPLLGAAADRWSRRWCAVVGDLVRAVAFVGIAVTGSFELTLVLALLAGTGTALFRPAVLAALPSLVREERTPAATSLYGAISDFGYTAGPALAAGVLALVGAEELLAANGVTFAVSAAVLARLPFGEAPDSERSDESAAQSLLGESREGLRAVVAMPGVRVIVAAFGAAMFFGGVYNVIELPFATEELGTNASGFSLLVAIYGVGFIGGSLQGSEGGEPAQLKRRYLQGLALTGTGGILAGLAPSLELAVLGFAIGGFGNGLFIVHQRLLFQSEVPQRLQGRVFGVSDGAMSWGLAIAFLSAGALTELAGARSMMLLTGAGELALATLAVAALRQHWPRLQQPSTSVEGGERRIGRPELGARGEALGSLDAREKSPHLVRSVHFWLTLLDDLGDGRDDRGVELRTRVAR